jgi:glycosyltransferase involved in cell wall biosynthesis
LTSTKPDLVLFTRRFPYGEAVLRGELAVTADRFRRVFVVPSDPAGVVAELPANATVVDLGWSAGWSRMARLRALISRSALKVLGRTLRHRSNWRAYAAGAPTYFGILATNLLKARSLRRWIADNDLRDAVFYDYWFENSTLALAVLRDLDAIHCAVSRAHGFDVFDERWGRLGRVPFREFKAERLDAIFSISQGGVDYLREKLGPGGEKVRLARLGVAKPPPSHPQPPPDRPLVVSCAVMRPLKRVHLIPEVLFECGQPLHWVHFGDGPERARVESAAAALPDEVTWELRGWVDNAEVHEFYATHRVSAFLSLSASEGVPVSMMEAQSYGVPIVALAVGGVPEVVQAETGVLLPPEASTAAIAEALTRALGPGRFDAERLRALFATRFDASANYEEFADALVELWSGGVAPISS